MEATRVSIDRWMNKEDVRYIGILLSNKKERWIFKHHRQSHSSDFYVLSHHFNEHLISASFPLQDWKGNRKYRGGKGSVEEADTEEGKGTMTAGCMIFLESVRKSFLSTPTSWVLPCWPLTKVARDLPWPTVVHPEPCGWMNLPKPTHFLFWQFTVAFRAHENLASASSSSLCPPSIHSFIKQMFSENAQYELPGVIRPHCSLCILKSPVSTPYLRNLLINAFF